MNGTMKDPIDVDFLQNKLDIPKQRPQKQRGERRGLLATIAGLAVLGMLFFSYQVSKTQSPNASGNQFTLLSGLAHLVNPGSTTLEGAEDDRINVLLMGVGGEGHDGAQLTDTLILASFRPSTGEIGMISIPRDLAVNIPGYGYTKINSANAYGERDNGRGEELAKEVVSTVLDQPVHYYVKIDFSSFEELIDAIGGVDVYVERSFTDSQYPTDDYKYQTVSFQEGWTTMDGETALQYSRSRHGNNGEGSDFARASRQQNVIMSAKEKLLSPSVLLNPAKLNRMANLFADNVETDISVWEMIKLAGHAPSAETDAINHIVLTSGPGGVLFDSTIGSAYVLKPKVSDWSEIQEIASNIFDYGSTERTDAEGGREKKTLSAVQDISVLVQNGTLVGGLASDGAQILLGSGFTVTDIQNAQKQDYATTVLVDLTKGQQPEIQQALLDYFEAKSVSSFDDWILSLDVADIQDSTDFVEDDVNADFILILGQNAEAILRGDN